MKFLHQKLNECFPASLAMVTDEPVETIIAKLVEPFGFTGSWATFVKEYLIHPPPIEARLNRFQISRHIQQLWPWLSLTAFADLDAVTTWTSRYPVIPRELRGRGIIIIKCPWYKHAVAYEDNMIFNPTSKRPISYGRWLKQIESKGWWTIEEILPYPDSDQQNESESEQI